MPRLERRSGQIQEYVLNLRLAVGSTNPSAFGLNGVTFPYQALSLKLAEVIGNHFQRSFGKQSTMHLKIPHKCRSQSKAMRVVVGPSPAEF